VRPRSDAKILESVDQAPKISVIVPAYNAERDLALCLDAIASSTVPPLEVIVVDDRSTDRTAEVARERGATVLTTETNSGPGAARNLAAGKASGKLLLFVDADVVVQPGTLARVASDFEMTPPIAAVFGSYDDEPEKKQFLSQYKNLQHHWVHQQGNPEASTFWAGCGAVRREIFLELGGFDLEKYPVPSIEDIELGYRLRASGHRILLDKQLQVKHLKRWTFANLLKTEIFCRAIPWTNLILESDSIVRDLNLKISDRISSVVAGLLVVLLVAAPFYHPAALAWLACLALFILLNFEFYRFFVRRRGWFFAIRVIPLHALYYLYSAAAFAWCWLRHKTAGSPTK